MILSLLLAVAPQFADASVQSLEARLRDKSSSADTRVLVLEELALRTGAVSWSTVEAAKSVGRGPWLIDYVRIMGRAGEPAIDDLKKFTRNRSDLVRAEAVYGLIQADQENGEVFARKVLRSSSEPVEARVAALRGLADRGSLTAHVEALRQLSSDQEHLQLEALDILARDPGSDDVRYLIDVVSKEDGRVEAMAVRLLQQITGYRIGNDARSWRFFMMKHDNEGTEFKRETQGQPASEQTLSYMGIPIHGKRIVFVLDASGSMNAPLAERTRQTRGVRATEELADLLPRLPGDASFDIVFFESQVHGYSSGRLVRCTEDKLEDAADWLGRRRFDGGTNLFGGLEVAFDRRGVDEVILLTDGMPSVGEIQDPARILAWVQRWNRWRKVRVNTVGLSAPRAADWFLAKLAEQNSGVYRAIR